MSKFSKGQVVAIRRSYGRFSRNTVVVIEKVNVLSSCRVKSASGTTGDVSISNLTPLKPYHRVPAKFAGMVSKEGTSTKAVPTTVEVDVEFVKQAYEAAGNEQKERIAKQFPDLFPRGYDFGKSFLITTDTDSPIWIGQGCAPSGKKNRCLMVRKDSWKMEVTEQGEYHVIEFFKK